MATVGLKDGAPEQGLEITLRSNDPARMLLSTAPDVAGSAEIQVSVKAGFRQSEEFWIQGLGGGGAVSYTATAPGSASADAVVTLAPAGLALIGPFGAPRFSTTIRAMPSRLTIRTMLLDKSLKCLEEQMVAGGRAVEVRLTSSDPEVGTVADSLLSIPGGNSTAVTFFQPAGPGSTTLSIGVPAGFSPPSQMALVTAAVNAPGLAVTDKAFIGQNLQIGGLLSLGEAAPEQGLTVTLTSEDPERLLLSESPHEVGSGKVEITIEPGGSFARYYLQALAAAGSVRYTAAAPNHRSRTGTITLAPSGVMITPASYGPPDEGEVLRPDAPVAPPQFVTSVAMGDVPLAVWTAQLDPVTRRGADITVQPLRAGITLNVQVGNTNPAVGTVESTVVIEGGSEHARTQFTPVSAGSTVISVATPPGFTTPSNGTTVKALVGSGSGTNVLTK
jgi:hypothetical protein